MNSITGAVEATIASSVVAGSAGVVVSTSKTPTIESLAGGIAGAGTAAVRQALATNDIEDPALASINASTVTSFGSVTVSTPRPH